MRILEVSPFSAGICGVWARVSKEAELLSEAGHEVCVFSSNIKRGSGKIELAPEFEELNKVKIHRFKTFGHFGDNTFFWNFSDEVKKINPDIIITHAYRQYYSTRALRIAKKLKIPCILVTHAPFLERKLRNWKLNLMVWVYDTFIGRIILNQYSKIFTITKWEIPFLKELGVQKNKIVYVPNGIPEEFFRIKIPKNKKNKIKQILFLGRIAPIKDIETLLKAFRLCLDKNRNIVLNLIGPSEEKYRKKIELLIKKLRVSNDVKFYEPVYNLIEKIKLIDNSDIFILPSKREGMPQALIEAMAREKLVISSNTEGGKEIVKDNENGFLFEIGDERELAEKIQKAMEGEEQILRLKKNAKKSVVQFSWGKISKKIKELIEKEVGTKPYKDL